MCDCKRKLNTFREIATKVIIGYYEDLMCRSKTLMKVNYCKSKTAMFSSGFGDCWKQLVGAFCFHQRVLLKGFNLYIYCFLIQSRFIETHNDLSKQRGKNLWFSKCCSTIILSILCHWLLSGSTRIYSAKQPCRPLH